MAKKPNYRFERSERARQKEADKTARLVAKREKPENRNRLATFREPARRTTP